MKTMREKKYDEYVEDEISGTLRNKSGNYGGGSEVLVIYYTDTVGALCMDDYKGANKQYVEQEKLIIMKVDDNYMKGCKKDGDMGQH